MANLATGPFIAACLLLLVSGFGKVRNPAGTEPALRAIGLPASRNAVRLLGLTELAVGVAGLFFGPAAIAVAVLFAGLAFVAWRLHRTSPSTPCGCLGASSAPVSRAHVVVNLAAMVVALCSISTTAPVSRLTDAPIAGIVLFVLAIVLARLAVLTFAIQEASS